jgi:PRTRC genetic system protein E
LRDSYSGWIIAGDAGGRVGGCERFQPGLGDGKPAFREKEGEENQVFTELMPLLKQRVVMITISDVGEGFLRVNVIPRKLEGSTDENGALTVPLSITGKAEELDRELPGQLVSFTQSVTQTGSNLDELRTQHAAAIKAVEAENRKKIDDKKKGNGPRPPSTAPTTPTPTAEFKEGKPIFGSRPPQQPVESRSLFDNPASADNATTEDDASKTPTAPEPQHPHASTSS